MISSDELIDAFDAAWAAAEENLSAEPVLENFRLPEGTDEPHQHLEDLIEIDLAYRWKRAMRPEPPSLGEYVSSISESESVSVFSASLVAEAYQLSRSYQHSAKKSDYLPFAADQNVARQLLCEVDQDWQFDQNSPEPETATRTETRPVIPDFEVESVLGRGGKGIVFKARQISVGRTVAVKSIPPSNNASVNDIKRLRNEAQILGSLRHPNIVTVYSLEQSDNGCCIVMEYVSGSDLSFHQREGSLSIRDTARHMLTVANAIHVAHEHDILHRDIKPSNILLDDHGTIRVTDFGLSRRMERSGTSDPLTATTEVLGTPGYISPEQAQGHSRDLDETADVYGIGATLYSLLVGIAPFTGHDVISILQHVCERAPTPPRVLQPEIPSTCRRSASNAWKNVLPIGIPVQNPWLTNCLGF